MVFPPLSVPFLSRDPSSCFFCLQLRCRFRTHSRSTFPRSGPPSGGPSDPSTSLALFRNDSVGGRSPNCGPLVSSTHNPSFFSRRCVFFFVLVPSASATFPQTSRVPISGTLPPMSNRRRPTRGRLPCLETNSSCHCFNDLPRSKTLFGDSAVFLVPTPAEILLRQGQRGTFWT